MARIKFAVRSDVGRIRTNNEDNFFCNGVYMTVSERERPFFMSGFADVPCVFAVCDGMGGEDCGELASLTAVETLKFHAKNLDVNKFVSDANDKLCAIMRSQGLRMGTTLALATADENSFRLYNIGDSRIYRLNNERLLRVTDDHTLAEDKMRMGLLTPAQAEKSRDKHILMRYLGMFDDAFVPDADSYGPFDFSDTRRILLCSDGLTDMLEYRDIAKIMSNTENVSDAVNNLVDAALMRGGRDNVTCIVLEA